MLWCRNCRKEFLTYRLTGESKCPDCGGPCSDAPPRSAHVGDADMSENGIASQASKALKIVLSVAILGALAFGTWQVYKNPLVIDDILNHFERPSANAPDANAPDGNEPPVVVPDSPEGAANPTP